MCEALGDFDRGAFEEVPNEVVSVVLSVCTVATGTKATVVGRSFHTARRHVATIADSNPAQASRHPMPRGPAIRLRPDRAEGHAGVAAGLLVEQASSSTDTPPAPNSAKSLRFA